MFNLNKRTITKQSLLEKIEPVEIFSYYTNTSEIVVGVNILSPLRTESHPSFGFFLGQGNELCFIDFKTKLRGDCIKLVQELFNMSFFEALSKIAIDFKLDNEFIIKSNIKKENRTPMTGVKLKIKNKTKLGKIRRSFSLKDVAFWKNFGISIETLKKYNVESISHIIIDGNPIKCDDYAYAFIEHKDNIETYKIYQPFNPDFKWLNSHDESTWQGWTQLSNDSNYLIITKSLKDVMSIVENTAFDAVSLQSEGILPKEKIIEELKSRYDYIYIFYDNDFDKEENIGQICSKRINEITNFTEICIPDTYKCKDFTDLIKKFGVKDALSIFENDVFKVPF